MFTGSVEDFVAGLRAARGFDASTLVFETVPTDALSAAYADARSLQRRLDAAVTAMAAVLHDRRADGTGAPPTPDARDGTAPDGAAPDGTAAPVPPIADDRASREAARLGAALRDLPHTKAAFDAGRLCAEQAKLMVRFATDATLGEVLRTDERALVDELASVGPDGSAGVMRAWKERVSQRRARRDATARHRKRSMRSYTDSEGFRHWHITGADGDAAVLDGFLKTLHDRYYRTTRPGSASSDGPIDERTRDQRDFDAVTWALELAVAGLSGDAAQPRPRTTMLVHLEYDDLLAGRGGVDLPSGTRLSGADIRRLLCDAGVARLVTQGDSIALDRGREVRLATTAQRETLAAMYATCARPGCSMPFAWCQVHHIDEFTADLGETNIDDLVPMCHPDHHEVHHGGHEIVRGERTGEKVWVTSDGVRYPIVPDPPPSLGGIRSRSPDEVPDRPPDEPEPGQLDLRSA